MGNFAHSFITLGRTTSRYNVKQSIRSEISACCFKNFSICTQILSGKLMVSPSDMEANISERPTGTGATPMVTQTAKASPSRILKTQVSLASY